MSRFIDKEFTYAAERTTARMVTGFENDEVAFHAFEVIKWDGVPGAKAVIGTLDTWRALLPSPENRAAIAAEFNAHVAQRL